jgi:hypothetical protein
MGCPPAALAGSWRVRACYAAFSCEAMCIDRWPGYHLFKLRLDHRAEWMSRLLEGSQGVVDAVVALLDPRLHKVLELGVVGGKVSVELRVRPVRVLEVAVVEHRDPPRMLQVLLELPAEVVVRRIGAQLGLALPLRLAPCAQAVHRTHLGHLHGIGARSPDPGVRQLAVVLIAAAPAAAAPAPALQSSAPQVTSRTHVRAECRQTGRRACGRAGTPRHGRQPPLLHRAVCDPVRRDVLQRRGDHLRPRSQRRVTESRWVSKPLAFTGKLRPPRLNHQPR